MAKIHCAVLSRLANEDECCQAILGATNFEQALVPCRACPRGKALVAMAGTDRPLPLKIAPLCKGLQPRPARKPGSNRRKPKWPQPTSRAEALARVILEALSRGRCKEMGLGFLATRMDGLGYSLTMGHVRGLCEGCLLHVRTNRGIAVLALDERARQFAVKRLEQAKIKEAA